MEPHDKLRQIMAQLAEQTAEKLSTSARCRHAIIIAIKQRVLPAGSRLVEADLCEAFHVSRTPLREALTALRADGILAQDSQSLRVRKLAWRDIHELYDMRALLEGAAAQYAARHAGPAEKQVIAALIKTESQLIAAKASPDILAAHNVQFHDAIMQAARNPFLTEALERLSHLFILIGDTAYSLPDRVSVIAKQHAAINDAIQTADEAGAEGAMRVHLQDALAARLRLLCDGEASV